MYFKSKTSNFYIIKKCIFKSVFKCVGKVVFLFISISVNTLLRCEAHIQQNEACFFFTRVLQPKFFP